MCMWIVQLRCLWRFGGAFFEAVGGCGGGLVSDWRRKLVEVGLDMLRLDPI